MRLFPRIALVSALLFVLLSMSASAFNVTSPMFEDNGYFNYTYTCLGADVSPEFNISDLPDTTVAMAVLVNDTDANFVHWAMIWNTTYNGSDTSYLLGEGVEPNNSTVLNNDFFHTYYDGPCPPGANALPLDHNYEFLFYALNSTDITTNTFASNLVNAIQNSTINQTIITALARSLSLFGPDNDSDVGDTVNLTYGVAQHSPECTLYTNTTGSWASFNNASATGAVPSSNSTATNNFTFDTTSLLAGDYLWNVVCNTTTLDKGFAIHNYTFNVAVDQNISVEKTLLSGNATRNGTLQFIINITNKGNVNYNVNVSDLFNSSFINYTGEAAPAPNESADSDEADDDGFVDWLGYTLNASQSVIFYINMTALNAVVDTNNSVEVFSDNGSLLGTGFATANVTTTVPQVNASYPNSANPLNTGYFQPPLNISFSVGGDDIDSVYYYLNTDFDGSGENTTFVIGSGPGEYHANISELTNSTHAEPGAHSVFFCANNSAGEEECNTNIAGNPAAYTIYNANVSLQEEAFVAFTLNVTYENGSDVPADYWLWPNGFNYTLLVNISGLEAQVVGLNINYTQAESINLTQVNASVTGAVSNAIGAGYSDINFTWVDVDSYLNASFFKYGVVVFPGTGHGVQQYCSGTLAAPTCSQVTQCNSTNITISNHSLSIPTDSACYLETSGKTVVYMDHFSGGAIASDNTPPHITYNSPVNNTLARNRSLLINVTFSDNGSGLNNVTYNITINTTQYLAGANLTCLNPANTSTNSTCWFTGSNLGDGNYVVYSTAEDGDGNSATSILYFNVSATPPDSVTSLAAVNISNDSIYWTWTNPGNADFNSTLLYLNGTLVANLTQGNTSYNATGLLSNTVYNLTIHTQDKDGNINNSDVTNISMTNANPFVPNQNASVTKVADANYVVNGTSNNLSFIITVENVGNTNFSNYILVDNYSSHLTFASANVTPNQTSASDRYLNWTLNLSSGESISINVTFNIAALGNATNYVRFFNQSFNVANHTIANATDWVNISAQSDTTPPGSITSLTNASLTNQSIYWTWTNPGDADFNASILYLNGTNIANVTNGSSAYNVTGLEPLTVYNLTVHTKDQSGNINDSDVTSIAATSAIPDTIAPGFVLNAPGAGTTVNQSTTRVNVTINDGNSGLDVSTITLIINGTSYAFGSLTCASSTDGVTSNTCAVTTGALPDGNIDVNVSATDLSGNVNSSLFTFIKNDTAPTITVSNPTSGSTIYAQNLFTIVNVSFDERVSVATVSFNGSRKTICSSCHSGLINASVFAYGSRNVTINATDATGNKSSTSFLITYVKDLNGNNIDDDAETGNATGDTDGDGVANINDSIYGNASNIATNIPDLNITIGGSFANNATYSGSQTVNINGNGTTIVSFNYNLNAASNQTLDFTQISVQKQDSNATSGSIVISGIDLSAQGTTKTIVMDRLNMSSSGVCIVDEELASIDEVQNDCSNGVQVECNGVAQSGFTCTKINSNTQYQISGLTHSGVVQNSYTAPEDDDDDDDSPSGGSSGGGGRSSPSENKTATGTGWSNIQAGDLTTYAVGNANIAVDTIAFTVTQDLTGVSLDIASYEHRPFALDDDAPGSVFQYLAIDSFEITEYLDMATVTFRVPQTWVTRMGVDRDAVALYRHDGTDWNGLSTSYVRTSGSDYIYEAESPGFSYFAIAAEDASAPVEQEVDQVAEDLGEEDTSDEDSVVPELTEEEETTSSVGWIVFGVLILALLVGGGIWYLYQQGMFKGLKK